MKIDQEFKSLIPSLTSEEYKQLEQNIINEGCRDALVTWNDTLIDGHHRYEICTKDDIPFKTVSKEFSSREEVKEWIVRNQFGRRNLLPIERSRLALRLENIISKKNKEKQLRKSKSVPQNSTEQNSPMETRDEIAEIAGVSTDTIARVKVIEREASPEQKEALTKGIKTINKVFREIRPKKLKPEIVVTVEEKIIEDDNCRIEKPESKYEANKRINKCLAEVVRDLHDDNKVIVITSDDLVRDLQSFTDTFIRNANRSVSDYDVTITQENSKKITAILSEVEQAVEKIKGCFINE